MRILQSIKLLFPALIPSWNFFDIIAPSPQIQFVLLNAAHTAISDWQVFRPRPQQIKFSQALKQLFWNPQWNESLFLVSCAERIMENYTTHSENEIFDRIQNDLSNQTMATHLQFRLVYTQRIGTELNKEIMFVSRTQEIVWKRKNES